MNQYFTTLEFADLLKEFGIEIKTPYYSFLLKYEDDLTNIMFGMYSASLGRYVATNGWTYNEDDVEQVKPAYILQQVLEWLPETIESQMYYYDLTIRKNGNVGYHDSINGYSHKEQPIEQLFIKLLQDGIITKKTILNNSKPL